MCRTRGAGGAYEYESDNEEAAGRRAHRVYHYAAAAESAIWPARVAIVSAHCEGAAAASVARAPLRGRRFFARAHVQPPAYN